MLVQEQGTEGWKPGEAEEELRAGTRAVWEGWEGAGGRNAVGQESENLFSPLLLRPGIRAA